MFVASRIAMLPGADMNTLTVFVQQQDGRGDQTAKRSKLGQRPWTIIHGIRVQDVGGTMVRRLRLWV